MIADTFASGEDLLGRLFTLAGMDAVPGSANRVELPLACTLGPDDGPARLRRWQRLADAANPSARRDGHRLEVRYKLRPGVLEELEDLAAAEAQCCASVTWTVTQDGDDAVLHVTAELDTPDDVAPIAALFGAA